MLNNLFTKGMRKGYACRDGNEQFKAEQPEFNHTSTFRKDKNHKGLCASLPLNTYTTPLMCYGHWGMGQVNAIHSTILKHAGWGSKTHAFFSSSFTLLLSHIHLI